MAEHSSVTPQNSFPLPPPHGHTVLPPLTHATTGLLSSYSFTFSRISPKQIHTVHEYMKDTGIFHWHLSLASFEAQFLEIHPSCHLYKHSIPFHCRVIFQSCGSTIFYLLSIGFNNLKQLVSKDILKKRQVIRNSIDAKKCYYDELSNYIQIFRNTALTSWCENECKISHLSRNSHHCLPDKWVWCVRV